MKMDQKDIRFIASFMEAFQQNKETISRIEQRLDNKNGWQSKIEDRSDLQLKLCSVVMAIRESNMGRVAMDAFPSLLTVQGAVEFLSNFAIEVGRLNLGFSAVEKGAESTQDTIKIRLVDLHLAYENLAEFKMELNRLIEQKGGVTSIASQAGMSQPSLSKMFNTSVVPRQSTIRKLYEALGIEFVELRKQKK